VVRELGGSAGPRRDAGPRGGEEERGEAGCGREKKAAKPRGGEGGVGRGWAERIEGGIFLFYFLLIFPIIHFISNFLLNAYLTETKQIHTKGNRCVAQHDATTKENISRVYLHKISS
jgi:hypothetical protein